MSERVILLHGLWMRPTALAPLARRLRDAGFATEKFDYGTLRGGPELAVRRLRERVQAANGERVHLVGHSLGGLISLECARQSSGDRGKGHGGVGRVVCLGSPLRGSSAARSMAGTFGTAWLMGESAALLQRGLDDWCGECEVGVIAGRMPFGLGFLLGGVPSPHDGTVAVSETELPGVHAHCVVAASHTGLLFSERAVAQTVRFLRDGCFD